MKHVLISAALLVLAACTKEQAAPQQPVRVPITASDEGYTPSEIAVKAGQPVTLVFTRTTTSECLEKVLIPSQKVDKDLPVNQPVEVTFTPEKPGVLEFTCGMEMFKGTIAVN
ncbi:MAG: cupredoxin domain-containing protein [Myxococcota bacterium]